VFLDMVQNNPGDAVAWQQTKFVSSHKSSLVSPLLLLLSASSIID
jgi:hypothetical protein